MLYVNEEVDIISFENNFENIEVWKQNSYVFEHGAIRKIHI